MQRIGRLANLSFFVALACITMLIMPAGCVVDIKFSGNEGPYTYKTSEDVSISWHLDYYPSMLKSYEIYVSPENDKSNRVDKSDMNPIELNDVSPGEHSPIDRSINFGKMNPGTYFAAFTSESNDNFPPINDHGIFFVAPSKGSIKITSYNEVDGNSEKQDGTPFQITGHGQVLSANTGSDGTATISVPVGLYTITESPRDCWRSLTGVSQIVTVLEDQESSVVFRDEPDTGYTIFGYNSSTRNGIAGFTFTVSGPDGTQTLVSGSDGFARPSRIGRPGTYIIIATPPVGMEMATPSRKEFNPCEEKQIDFGAYNITPLRIDSVSPSDKSRMGSNDVLFTWRTSEVCKSELHIKQQGRTNVTVLDGHSGIDHSATAVNLTRNKWYDFSVKAKSGSRLAKSNGSIFIDNGITFTKWRYEVNIDRNYSQNCLISVKNTDSKPHDLRVGVNSSARDIYFNFLGGGSADKVITLSPGETRDLDLVIHAQDALERNYTLYADLTNLGPEKIVDNAIIEVGVRWVEPSFDFKEVSTDPVTLTKTFRITNLGDPITDLSVIPDNALLRNTVIQPSVRHTGLKQNEAVDVQVSPIWSEDIGAIKGTLTASAAVKFNKTLDVDFSCKEGRQLHEVVLSGPQLHFDLKGGYCVNQHPITDSFTLPPGLKAGDILNAYIGMEFNPKDEARQLTRYSTWIKINDNEVGRLNRTIPSGYHMFDVDPTYFKYTQAGLASNKYVLDSDMNRGYSTFLSDVSVVMCLKNLTLYVCAENEQQAKEIAWSSNWLYKPSDRINVTVLSPMEGKQVDLGQPVAIKVRVDGIQGGEKYCIVKGSINGSNQVIKLVDNGLHDDGLANDGVYGGLWIPDTSGRIRIDISAGNCAVAASASVTVTSIGINDSSLWLTRTMEPPALDVRNMNTEEGNVITYTITLGPRGEGIKDVKVIQTLPNYLQLNTNSLSRSGTVSLSNEGQNWSTTSVMWNIGELTEPWSVTFDTIFNWRLPAGVNYMAGSSMPTSVVTYTSATNGAGRLEIPEGEIRFISGAQERTAERQTPVATETRPSPGVEPVFALLGILFVVFALRRR